MKSKTMATFVASLWMIALLGCSTTPGDVPSRSGQEPLVVFLVRHGEKADLGRDPELSVAGGERAAALARCLRSAEIEYVHSTDYIRTRGTAAPVAAAYGLEVERYSPRDLSALVEKLRGKGGRHLVVGHSTTTPAMVELLGGKPGSAINEEGEFDRLYILMISRDGAASTAMMRYGRPYEPSQRQ